MDLAQQSGIIVDSSFSSRKILSRDLHESKLVEEIYEATSIADAIKRLISQQTDLCFIGPTVSTPVMVNFAKSVRTIASRRACAIVAVLKAGQRQEPGMIEAGISGILQQPYSKETFTAVTLNAIRQARTDKAPAIVKTVPQTSAANLINALASDLIKHSNIAQFNAAAEGNLHFQQKFYGELKANIAKRLENLAGADPENDALFARAITEWFFEAARLGCSEATENLRLKLVSNSLG